ncbi:MAG: AAA family ATPase [Elainellaceae cyanobacterium]
MPTLIASPIGLERVRQTRREKGWGWSTDDDDTCLIEASRILAPDYPCFPGGPYANGISSGTWKRFLAGRHPIRASAFKAYCEALELDWQTIVVRDNIATDSRHQDWGEAPEIAGFCGRSPELTTLSNWMGDDSCRLVGVFGMAGMGKTSLMVKAAEQVQSQFQILFYRSLQSAPPVEELLAELLEFLNTSKDSAPDKPKSAIAESAESSVQPGLTAEDDSASTGADLDQLLSRLLDELRDRRCLLLLDDVETVLQEGQLAGQYREQYQGYGSLLRRIGSERHQSCLVIISREQPREIAAMAGSEEPVRELRLQGLSISDGKAVLEGSGLSSQGSAFDALIQRYRGNPSALKVVSQIVREFFGGDIIQFMSQSTVFVSDVVSELLAQQIGRLSTLESEVMYWLAIACQPISLAELRLNLWRSVSLTELLGALQSLQRRSLIEKDAIADGGETIFTLQPVVMKFVTTQFIERTCRELAQLIKGSRLDDLNLLRSHALVSDRGTDDDMLPIQVRLILNRVRDRLYSAVHPSQVETGLQQLLEQLQGQPAEVVGYAEPNIRILLTPPVINYAMKEAENNVS